MKNTAGASDTILWKLHWLGHNLRDLITMPDDLRARGGRLETPAAQGDGVDRVLRRVFSRDAMIAVVRIDKWLWAARFFKTRSLAGRACELGRIESNGQTAKAAREVKVGDSLRVKTEGGEYQVEVLGVSEMRGPAAVAQGLYRETDASRELRLKLAAERKAMFLAEGMPVHKPSKRDRRQIHRFRGMD